MVDCRGYAWDISRVQVSGSDDKLLQIGHRLGEARRPNSASDADGDDLGYSLAPGGANESFTIDGEGLIRVKAGLQLGEGAKTLYALTAQVTDGENASGNAQAAPVIDDTIEVTVKVVAEALPVHHVPLAPSVSHPRLQGFFRVVNHFDEAGEVAIVAIDGAEER